MDSSHAFRTSVTALYNALFPLVASAVLVGLIVYSVVNHARPVYEVHFSYVVGLAQREPTSAFRYDGFYALSSAESFTDTFASLLTAPESIVRTYNVAQILLPTQNPFGLKKNIEAQKSGPQAIAITVRDSDKDVAQKLSVSVSDTANHVLSAYNTNGGNAIGFSITKTDPWTGMVRIQPLPVALIVAISAFFAGCMIVLFRAALQRESH